MAIDKVQSHKSWVIPSLIATLVVAAACGESAYAAEAEAQGKDLVRMYCSACHHESAGQFERISSIRKTPEGWVMTLFRMRQMHGLMLPEDVHDALVRYLADTQGLAPEEAAAGRFALERRPNAKDLDLGAETNVMCGRCHSLARVALQRRDAEEWRKLANMHVGQWPSLEYSSLGRDRPWFQIATGPLPAKLAAQFPFATTAWSEWQQRSVQNLSGDWVVVGHVPGGRDFSGAAHLDQTTDGNYTARYQFTDLTGIQSEGHSTAIVYTGYEWRGRAEVDGRSLREVYAVSADGNRIAGRWFDPDHEEEGGDWLAVRDTGTPRILAVLPHSQRAGITGDVVIVGTGLSHLSKSPTVSFGDGVVVTRLRIDGSTIRAQVKVPQDAVAGLRTVSVGGIAAAGDPAAGDPATGDPAAGDPAAGVPAASFAVYRHVDRIDVVPGYAIARVGGGRVAPVSAQFEALASTRLPDGGLLALGPVMANWTWAPFDAEAKRTEDDKFAGHFDQRGRFLPGGAGPNTAREFSGDNVGNLTVIAHPREGDVDVEGHGHLIVTVQRWNTPPIY